MKSNRRFLCRSKCIAVAIALLAVLASLWNVLVFHWQHSLLQWASSSGSSVILVDALFPAANGTPSSETATKPTTTTLPQPGACVNSNGVFHIGIADIEGGVGTALYQLILLQLDYAERYNLTPWVHLLPNVSKVIDDENDFIDDDSSSPRMTTFTAIRSTVSRIEPIKPQHWRHVLPGPPVLPTIQNDTASSSFSSIIQIPGGGIWNHYFAPVSSFVPGDASCRTYVTIPLSDIDLIIPGLHGFGPIRCWRYEYLPEYERRHHQSWEYWIAPSRKTAARLVQRYIQPHFDLIERAKYLNPPHREMMTLGLHIRHSDKAAGRTVIPVEAFLPYVTAFVQAGGQNIYLATDSGRVIEIIQTTWPTTIVSKMKWSDQMMRSNDTKAVFDIAPSHYQSNQDAIVEILALSHCQYLLHGLSALSEAAIWHNPQMFAVNLEDEAPLSPHDFQTVVELRDRPQSEWPHALYPEEVWYRDIAMPAGRVAIPRAETSHTACRGFDGVLWINQILLHSDHDDTSDTTMASVLFSTTVAEQLVYAHLYNLKPWVHLTKNVDFLLDRKVHKVNITENSFYPQARADGTYVLVEDTSRQQWDHNGIWNSYFEPLSDFSPDDRSCQNKPIIVYGGGSRVVVSTHHMQSEEVVDARKHFQFRSYLIDRAREVLPDGNGCLGVHIQLANKHKGRKIRAGEYLPYIEAFVQAGGECIYLVTDTEKALRYITKNIPERLRKRIHTQGNHTVRSEKGDFPTHMLDDHHRVNSETLVDVLALSKCVVQIHSNSALAHASRLLNPSMQSLNLENIPPQTPKQFEMLARFALGKDDAIQENTEEKLIEPQIIARQLESRPCRQNAIVYLAQKNHSSYGRDSYSNLIKSIDLLNKNYLSRNNNMERLDLFIFHTNDFDESDLDAIEARIGASGVVRLVDLTRTQFWTRPIYNARDRPEDWYAWPLFSEGYRRMMHWFAIDIWRFFEYLNERSVCNYRYIFRLDEDSYIHSPIDYDIFNFMAENKHVYGFRMCAYELQVTQRMSTMWTNRHEKFVPKRDLSQNMCGFYNNFFVADLSFFRRPDVASFLEFIDRQGHIYRRRLGDLMIHSMAVYWFAESTEIHRFLDFTYEHSTKNNTDGCLLWGGMQAGYNDRNALKKVSAFQSEMLSRGCAVNASSLSNNDLSPTYSHLTKQVALATVTAGRVELPPGRGILSG